VGSRFSKTFSFTDINYSIASKDDKTAMFLDYSELLNALNSGASAEIIIHNRRIYKAQFEKTLLLPMWEDGMDHFRRELVSLDKPHKASERAVFGETALPDQFSNTSQITPAACTRISSAKF